MRIPKFATTESTFAAVDADPTKVPPLDRPVSMLRDPAGSKRPHGTGRGQPKSVSGDVAQDGDPGSRLKTALGTKQSPVAARSRRPLLDGGRSPVQFGRIVRAARTAQDRNGA